MKRRPCGRRPPGVLGMSAHTVCMSAVSSPPPPPLKGLAEISKKSQNVKANLPLNFPRSYRSLETARVADGGCGRLGASAPAHLGRA